MSAPFRPQSVALGTGVREDLGALAVDQPESLQLLENVVFTKKGALRGRPAPVSADAQVQVYPGIGVVPPEDSIADALSGLIASKTAGVMAVQMPSSDGQESPLLHYQAASFVKTGSTWSFLGQPWSVRVTRSAALKTVVTDPPAATALGPASTGTSLVATSTPRGPTSGAFPFVNSDGSIELLSSADLSTFDPIASVASAPVAAGNNAAAGDAAFWATATGAILGAVHPTGALSGLLVTVGAGGSTTTATAQTVACVKFGSTYYVAFVSSTAGRVTMVQVSSTGTVSGTTNINGLGTVTGVALSINTAGTRLCLAWQDSATTSLKTKILNTSFVDQAIDVTLNATQPTVPQFTAGTFVFQQGAPDTAGIGYSTANGDYVLKARSYTAAVASTRMTLYGASNAFGVQAGWDALFGVKQVAGRDVVGVTRWELQDPTTLAGLVRVAQWYVLDVTNNLPLAPFVVAAGAARSMPWTGAIHVDTPDANSLAFCVPEGISFSSTGVTRAGYVRIALEAQGASVAHAHGHALTTNARLNDFDGVNHLLMGFPEDYPYVLFDTNPFVAGTLPLGTYTVQATWEIVNGQGQVVRSGQSNPITYTVAGIPRGINVTATIPQMHDFERPDGDVKVRLWATQTSPSAGAPLYFVTEVSARTAWLAASGVVTLPFLSVVDTTRDQLYTGGGVLDDQSPPAGDRGVAYAGERIWVADQRRVYASKIIRPGIAPAWNTSGLHTVELPATIGQIQALVGLDENLLVVGSTGMARVYGPGFDDLGVGNGWTFDVTSPFGVGRTGPRSVARTPEGVLAVTHEGETLLIQGFQPTPISRPVRDAQLVRGARDVAVLEGRLVTDGVYGTSKTNTTAVISTDPSQQKLLMVDLDYGHWATWTTQVINLGNEGAPNPSPNPPDFIAGVNGRLWTQATPSRGTVAVYSGDPGTDFNGVTMTIKTGILRPNEGPARGWGSVQGLTVHATEPTSANYDLQVIVRGDAAQRTLLNKTVTVAAYAGANWPAASAPEYRCTTQRASFVTVELRATPAIVEWSSIDLWVSSGSEPAPARSRS